MPGANLSNSEVQFPTVLSGATTTEVCPFCKKQSKEEEEERIGCVYRKVHLALLLRADKQSLILMKASCPSPSHHLKT